MTTTLTPPAAPAPAPVAASTVPAVPVRLRTPIVLAVLTLLTAVMAWATRPGHSTVRISTDADSIQIAPLAIPGPPAAWVLTVGVAVAAGLAFWYALGRRKVPTWLVGLAGLFAFLTVLVLISSGKSQVVPITGLLFGTLFLATPLVFGALSGVVCERVGIVNIAIEAQLLFGAFAAAVVASVAGSSYWGLIAAPLAGVAVAALLAWFSITYQVNQIIVGVVLNVLVVGLTGFLFSTVLRETPGLNDPMRLPVLPIPLLSEIPVIGPVLFRQNLLVYLMYAIVIGLQVMIFRSRWGLRLRAVGEHPKAADTVGIDVIRTRWRNTLLGGAIAGLGGAFFTVASNLAFGKEMTAGKGFIALAAMILGRWSPKGAVAAALLFGLAGQMQGLMSTLQVPVPSQFLAMIPYIVTIFAVAGFAGKVRAPAAEGIPYVK
ncbi:nucleoside ABC transporter membrane protein [Salana multivorans]|uniref:Nucleoside ABC transporter membrane protein n=1 Tax=Salana multivorans TaxID=120377 RepID=A0A3N2DCP6_9MICO|nr:ABC transporter permease [Salana multivorans]MBN8880959.1 ABC transporter permease [Salana multivorans]OJX97872.1 MAG: ABC transporter permease [Micrococcales bacterium 73-15]ROR97482.1 nucleoside ABC transporter membrane protein [Salana multivorans]